MVLALLPEDHEKIITLINTDDQCSVKSDSGLANHSEAWLYEVIPTCADVMKSVPCSSCVRDTLVVASASGPCVTALTE